MHKVKCPNEKIRSICSSLIFFIRKVKEWRNMDGEGCPNEKIKEYLSFFDIFSKEGKRVKIGRREDLLY